MVDVLAAAGRVAEGDAGAGSRTHARLVTASFLMLFLELALIRWLGSNVVHLSYFSNFVLLGSFLGIGLGFLRSRRPRSWWTSTVPLLAALVVLVLTYPVAVIGSSSQVVYFTSLELSGPPAWFTLPLIFLLVALIMVGPADQVGRCFAVLTPLTAYRLDLIGSLLGIVVFSLLAFASAPPVVWGSVVLVVALGLSPTPLSRILTAGTGAVLVAFLLLESMQGGTTWSPYYKLTTAAEETFDGTPVLVISANGVPHQAMAPAALKLAHGAYGTPYTRLPDNPKGNVLVIGAGSGSDVAIALLKGAEHVDAVDIDGRIMQIGVEQNPDHPYQDPRVTRHVNDGRAFLESTDTKYDLILFALPDSLTLVNGASQIRLESFLFTREAMQSVRAHLTPGGGFAMYNYYREDWLLDRLASTVEQAFGHPPCVDTSEGGGNSAVISVAVAVEHQGCDGSWRPDAPVVAPATDDAPFLYFRGGGIPGLYLGALLGILLASAMSVRLVGGPFRSMRPYADLFFMGAAFLLLETKNIATFALLFGTTWLVNALVFAGVLVIVLAAVEVTRRLRTPPLPVVYAGIAAALGLAWLVQPELLLGLPFWPRLAAAVLLAFLPIFLANVAFAKRFAESADSQSAFALNLLGALVGGCLEYTALLVGYDNLLIVTGGLYLAAFVLLRRTKATGSPVGA